MPLQAAHQTIDTMYTKLAFLGLVGSAAAFNAPMMSVRRDAIATGAAAAVVAPLLRPSSASAAGKKTSAKAPVVEIFDERDGCKGPSGATNGRSPPVFANGGDSYDDVMCVKVSMQTIKMKSQFAADVTENYDRK
eukprot:CAMPEP_0173427142 /NCGR_PEP_ID=MMETSP1357-20121228/6404_1 /TAXON_ID=77926 /ORGANISM="Hemiselmis rufescens, Strain PCC563" /LENGTH=134 /DNA_ID=CAMNT_0014390903 /DNA_START=75 /DNA_END=479 /DNA_ORIENTATION=+